MRSAPARVGALFAELKRRRVYQVAAVYAAAAFVVAQAADLFLPRLGLPDWTVTLVVVLAVAGFPVALILGWVFDITPYGIRRTDALPGDPTDAWPAGWRLAAGVVSATVVLVVAGWWLSFVALPPASATPSLIVLPFENLSGDPEQDFFAVGMHDALISELGRIGALHVISRTSAARYRQGEKSIPEIARELNVRMVVEGSVARLGDDVQVRVSLIEAVPAERHLWSDEYRRRLQEVLGMHGEIARSIAQTIRVELTAGDVARLGTAPLVDPVTYEAYLRGMSHLYRATPADVEAGLRYLHQAVDWNPADPLAYAGLAYGYITLGHGAAPLADAWPRAREAALRAVALAPRLPAARAALAQVNLYHEWDWEGAEREFQRANELNPSMAMNHYHQAWYFALFDRMDEAIAAHKRAQALDPLTPVHTAFLGTLYSMVGRHDEAIAEARRSLDLNPSNAPAALLALGDALLQAGRVDEAIETHQRLASAVAPGRGVLGHTYAASGRAAEAQRIADELESEPPGPWNAFWLASIHAALGNPDRALDWLAYEPSHAWLPWVRNLSWFRSLRGDPRFVELVRSMNLPPP
jgi:TolB-like protein/tetratricopeptide (TPR) repeat protein